MKKMGIFSFSLTFAGWVIMTFVDYLMEISEQYSAILNAAMNFVVYGLWIPALVVYIMFMKDSGHIEHDIREKLKEKFVWVAVNIVFFVPIFYLINNNKWIIKQAPTLLNGIEYLLFGIIYGVLGLFSFWIYDVIIFIKNRK